MVTRFQWILSFLPRSFYARNTVTVAKELLGKRLVRQVGNYRLSGIITETEAYRHKDDPASHAFRNKTERNKIMFEQVGMAYVYFTYGMYFCFNVVARNTKFKAGAVLIRAIHPELGIDIMKKNRCNVTEKNLTNGPAKLSQALGITKKQYGVDLTGDSKLFITEGVQTPKKIITSPRVGIKSGVGNLWNFKIQIT